MAKDIVLHSESSLSMNMNELTSVSIPYAKHSDIDCALFPDWQVAFGGRFLKHCFIEAGSTASLLFHPPIFT